MSLVQGIEVRAADGRVVWPVATADRAGGFAFNREPWPNWTVRMSGQSWLDFALLSLHDTPWMVLRFSDRSPEPGRLGRVEIDLLLTGRDYHGPLLSSAPEWVCEPVLGGAVLRRTDPASWVPPHVRVVTTGKMCPVALGANPVVYDEETRRGLDDSEVALIAARVTLEFRSGGPQAHYLILGPGTDLPMDLGEPSRRSALSGPGLACAAAIQVWGDAAVAQERQRRRKLADAAPPWLATASRASGFYLLRSADQFVVRRGRGYSILAGFPWFTDWGRDTFIAMRGLLMATERWELAAGILDEWSNLVSAGMLPNFFPDEGSAPEYNSVDAALWYAVCAGELMAAADQGLLPLGSASHERIRQAVERILQGYAEGTRYGIARDPRDGLLRAGQEGWQLTWMDARSDGREVTPRIGKPVEIQALWFNALRVGALWNPAWEVMAEQCQESFRLRYPDPDTGGLVDVLDGDHIPGKLNRQIRPNQIFAVGGLPFPLLEGPLADGVVALVHQKLWTPLGLRSLGPGDPEYCSRYLGDRITRDAQYHQGTVWGWLAGPFTEAYLRTHPGIEGAKFTEAEFLRPLEFHLRGLGLGHLTEVADGGHPHLRGGCPAQAWSLGEYLRCRKLVDGLLHPEGMTVS
jgi:hypothetical protein